MGDEDGRSYIEELSDLELATLIGTNKWWSDEEVLDTLVECGFSLEEVRETVQRLRAENEDPNDQG